MVNQHFYGHTLLGKLRRHPGQAETLAQRGTEPGAGHPAYGASAADHGRAVFGRGRAGHHESDQPLLQSALGGDGQSTATDEVGFVETDSPVGAYIHGRGYGIGVLPHNDVSLLETQNALRF